MSLSWVQIAKHIATADDKMIIGEPLHILVAPTGASEVWPLTFAACGPSPAPQRNRNAHPTKLPRKYPHFFFFFFLHCTIYVHHTWWCQILQFSGGSRGAFEWTLLSSTKDYMTGATGTIYLANHKTGILFSLLYRSSSTRLRLSPNDFANDTSPPPPNASKSCTSRMWKWAWIINLSGWGIKELLSYQSLIRSFNLIGAPRWQPCTLILLNKYLCRVQVYAPRAKVRFPSNRIVRVAIACRPARIA